MFRACIFLSGSKYKIRILPLVRAGVTENAVTVTKRKTRIKKKKLNLKKLKRFRQSRSQCVRRTNGPSSSPWRRRCASRATGTPTVVIAGHCRPRWVNSEHQILTQYYDQGVGSWVDVLSERFFFRLYTIIPIIRILIYVK